jgi:phosphoribosylglycinamide formyltransferase-1
VSRAVPGLTVLVSGSGRSLQNLAECIQRGELGARLALVISDRPAAGALERARALGIEALVIPWTRERGPAAASAQVFAEAERRGVSLVVLAGFLRLLVVPERWRGRVINIHPALLPKFGGRGFYGERVHAAVLAAGERESGCSVHLVDDQYDHGRILLQRRVPVLPGDDVHSLAQRVFEEEKIALPEAIRRLLAAPGAAGASSAC